MPSEASCSSGSDLSIDGDACVDAQDVAMQEAASYLPSAQEAQPSVPYDAEPEPAAAPTPPEPEPVAPKAPKAVKPTQLPPPDVIRSVLGHYNTAKRTIEALTTQLEAAKTQAADCLTPLTAYAPSWEHEGLWYMVYMAKGIRLTLRVSDKKPGRPPKDEG
jgi:hypothetical protein